MIDLPAPSTDGSLSLESAIQQRRSVRTFTSASLSLSDISQILWAGQGITQEIENAPSGWPGEQWPGGLKSAPSAGALYPLELYLLNGSVEGLETGLYRYIPESHSLEKRLNSDLQSRLSQAALGQSPLRESATVLIITGIYERSRVKYGERAARYVHMETGAAAQNIYLQCEALGLGTVFIGAFRDKQVQQLLQLQDEEFPLALMPVGIPGD